MRVGNRDRRRRYRPPPLSYTLTDLPAQVSHRCILCSDTDLLRHSMLSYLERRRRDPWHLERIQEGSVLRRNRRGATAAGAFLPERRGGGRSQTRHAVTVAAARPGVFWACLSRPATRDSLATVVPGGEREGLCPGKAGVARCHGNVREIPPGGARGGGLGGGMEMWLELVYSPWSCVALTIRIDLYRLRGPVVVRRGRVRPARAYMGVSVRALEGRLFGIC
ncbi:hypothetical protein C8T65DRAFT_303271 [Cerioporus squamosus]|nr:hypothetical protein C8T65DRAFT_303271 [Cerioporus squamosus]